MSKVYILVDERLMAAKNAKRSRHPRHFVVAAYSTMKKAQEAADGYLEALSFAPQGQGWKQGKLKGEITKTESSGKKSDKYGVLHATYRDDEAVLGHLRILTLTVNQPPEDEIDYMTAEWMFEGRHIINADDEDEVYDKFANADNNELLDAYQLVDVRGKGVFDGEEYDYGEGDYFDEHKVGLAETFGAERQVYVLRFGDPMRYGKAVELPFLTKNEAERYVDMHIRPWNKNHPWDEINYSITQETQFNAETFNAEEEVDFQVYAFINDDDNEWGDPIGQPMPEKSYLSGSDEFHYIVFDSIEECKKYIKDLPKGWSGNIEVIIYDEDGSNSEVISYEEYQNNMDAESFGAEKITKKERAALPDSDFALPKERKYPIPDLEHGRLALTYTQWHKPEDDAEVARAVLKKYPSLKGWWKEHKKSEHFYESQQKGNTASGHTVEYDDGSFYMEFAEPIQGYDEVEGDWYGGDNESPDDIELQVYHANENYDNFEISISDVESYGVSDNKRNRWRLDNDSRGNGPDIFVDMSDELVEAIEEGLNWMLGDIERIMGVRYGAETKVTLEHDDDFDIYEGFSVYDENDNEGVVIGMGAESVTNTLLPAFGLAAVGAVVYSIFLNRKKE